MELPMAPVARGPGEVHLFAVSGTGWLEGG